MKLVGAALRHSVDDAAHRLAVFRRVVRGNHLELLHGVLRNLRRDAGAAGVLVVERLGRVGSVHQEGVLSGHAAEGQQTEVAVVADARRQQHEGIDAAAVDRQILNGAGIDHARKIRLGVFDELRCGGYLNRSGGGADCKVDAEIEILADAQFNVLGFVSVEAGRVDGHFVTRSGGERRRGEHAVGVGGQVTDDALPGAGDYDFGAGHGRARRIVNYARNAGRAGSGLPECGSGKNQKRCGEL